MRKPRGFFARVFAASLIVWLGLVITEPLPLDACPMHGAHSMHAGAAMSHAGHQMTPVQKGGAPKTASHQCTCIGDCSAGAGSAIVRSPSHEIHIRVSYEQAAPSASGVVTAVSADSHRLPFANGPPAPGVA